MGIPCCSGVERARGEGRRSLEGDREWGGLRKASTFPKKLEARAWAEGNGDGVHHRDSLEVNE